MGFSKGSDRCATMDCMLSPYLEGEEVFSSELRRQGDVGGGRCVPSGGLAGHRCHSGWVGGHEMSRTLPVMPLLWRGHRFGHLSLCLVLVDVNDL